jgi:hypothetical protein
MGIPSSVTLKEAQKHGCVDDRDDEKKSSSRLKPSSDERKHIGVTMVTMFFSLSG